MTERVNYEGNPYSKLTQLIRDTGYAKPVNIEIATVIEAPPNLRIKLDQDGLILEKNDLVVAEHLTRHERVVTITHDEMAARDLGDRTERDFLHTDDKAAPYTHYKDNFVLMRFEDLLKPDDRIIVACLDEDMVYVVIDRAVWY